MSPELASLITIIHNEGNFQKTKRKRSTDWQTSGRINWPNEIESNPDVPNLVLEIMLNNTFKLQSVFVKFACRRKRFSNEAS